MPDPVVLIPPESLIKASRVGLESVIPPFLNKVSFMYNLISGPVLSPDMLLENPPTIMSLKLPFMSVLSSFA